MSEATKKFRRQPARFLLNNSKGYPDFVMTMLVAVTLALFLVLILWAAINILGFRLSSDPQASDQFVEFIKSFNQNSRLIVLGICSSVFSLAAAYYLRRKSYDDHYIQKENLDVSRIGDMLSGLDVAGFITPDKSTLTHPNYDDEDEDI